MTQSYRTDAVLAVLGAHRTLSLATVRPDGWPQVTMVGYINEGLDLYFVIARSSQKYANIIREPRVSIAIGGDSPSSLGVNGISMAAHVGEVTEAAEIRRFNQLIFERYPDTVLYSPTEHSTAVMRANPQLISTIRVTEGRSRTELGGVVDGRVVPWTGQ